MKIQILDEIKVTYQLNLDLYQQIKVYLKRNILNDKQDNKAFINSLPIFLKNELMSMMYKKIINAFNFFKNFDNIDFNVRVILSFKPIIAFRNDVLIKENEFVDDIIFVRSGKLTLELPLILEKENIKLKVSQ